MKIHIWEEAKIPLSLHFTPFTPYWRESRLGSSGRGNVKFNSGKSVLPDNHIDLFNQSVAFKKPNGEVYRYAQDQFGNIHRFEPSIDNYFHWSGSTSGSTVKGQQLTLKVPSEVQKFFK